MITSNVMRMLKRLYYTSGATRLFGAGLVCLILVAAIPSAWAQTIASGRITMAGGQAGQGVAGVMVTDGRSIIRTDVDGQYSFTLANDATCVFVVNPPVGQPNRDFYHYLPSEDRPSVITADFTLQQADRALDAPFSFVMISDSHMSSARGGDLTALPTIEAINRLAVPPSLVMETGDLELAPVSMEYYGKKLNMPYFPMTGNHDYERTQVGPEPLPYEGYIKVFEETFGPWYYAFYCGRYLFVAFPWSRTAGSLTEAADWLEQLLTMNAEREKAHVVVGFHHWDGLDGRDRFLDLFESFKVNSIFYGHWHLARVQQVRGIPTYVLRPPSMGTRDLGSGGFLLVQAHPDGKLDPEFRVNFHDKVAHIVAPAEGAALAPGVQPIAVYAYDSGIRVRDVTALFYDRASGAELASVALESPGGFVWTGRLSIDADWKSPMRMDVQVVDEHGETWSTPSANLAPGEVARSLIQPGADWPMLQRDPVRSGVSPDNALVPPLSLAWVHATDSEFGINSPIIVDGRVFVSVENNREAFKPMPAVLALDAVTGALLWTHDIAGSSVRGSLAAGSGKVCGLTDNGMVFALDAASGDLIWEQSNLASDPVWKELNTGSPVVRDSIVVAGSAPALSAYDLPTGRILWKTNLVSAGGRRWCHDPSPMLLGDEVIYGWENVYKLDLETGQERMTWEKDNSNPRDMITFNPTLAGDRILISPGPMREKRLVGVDSATFQTAWEFAMPNKRLRGIYTSPVANGNQVYAFGGQILYAVDSASGEILWTLSVDEGDDSAEITGSPAMAGDFLFFTHSTGVVKAISVKKRRVVWRYDLKTRINSSPAICGNALYVTGRDGALYAFVVSPQMVIPVRPVREPVSTLSEPTILNTVTSTRAVDESLWVADTRTYTEFWSLANKLDIRMPFSTTFMVY